MAYSDMRIDEYFKNCRKQRQAGLPYAWSLGEFQPEDFADEAAKVYAAESDGLSVDFCKNAFLEHHAEDLQNEK
jgi:hypothetical protein